MTKSALEKLVLSMTLNEARVLSPGCLFLGRQPLLLHYPRAFYEGTAKHELLPVSLAVKTANAKLIALAHPLACAGQELADALGLFKVAWDHWEKCEKCCIGVDGALWCDTGTDLLYKASYALAALATWRGLGEESKQGKASAR